MNSPLLEQLENILGERISNTSHVGGGCIATTQVIETISGKRFFLKSGYSNGMFLNEANGLRELAKSGAIRVPTVVACGDDFLLLEYIETGLKSPNFFEVFGKQFAEMHGFKGKHFGFFEDNFIGATPQLNVTEGEKLYDWTEFYWEKRLLYQFSLAEKNGFVSVKLSTLFDKLGGRIKEILQGSENVPVLLHGDPWGGNYMCDQLGNPVLIDPAVYYGNREADLAMTKLFGGFSNEFYRAYNQASPLPEGYEYRENIYLLYHVLNHLNLFGTSYLFQAENLISFYC
ncbi:fructosamine kinase [Puteibacter caeruleilacunae]|nr:fructosamine kinase [Puteibacter caeruleilacunae]